MRIEIVSIQSEDKNAILDWFRLFLYEHLKWWQRAFGVEPPIRSGHDEKQWRLLQEASTSDNDFVRVARVDGRAVGVIWATVKDEDWLECKVGQLNWIAVAPDFRGHGVGRMLLQAVEEWFESKNVSGKYLNVSEQNKVAIDLYKGFGYTVTDYRMLGRVDQLKHKESHE